MNASILLGLSLALAGVASVPSASAECEPGLLPTVQCIRQTVQDEAERDVAILLGVAGSVVNAACTIVFGDPRACTATIDAGGATLLP